MLSGSSHLEVRLAVLRMEPTQLRQIGVVVALHNNRTLLGATGVLCLSNISGLVFVSLEVTSFSIKMTCALQLFNIRTRRLYENGTINTERWYTAAPISDITGSYIGWSSA